MCEESNQSTIWDCVGMYLCVPSTYPSSEYVCVGNEGVFVACVSMYEKKKKKKMAIWPSVEIELIK